MRILNDPEAVAAILLLRKKGYSYRDVSNAWFADLPLPDVTATNPVTSKTVSNSRGGT